MLASVIGVRRQTISLYMSGQSNPDWEQIVKIAKHFEVSADWLLGLSDVKSMDVELKAVSKFLNLSEPAINNILKIAELQKAQFSEVTPLYALDQFLQNKDFPELTLCISEMVGKGVYDFSENLASDEFEGTLHEIEAGLKVKYGVDVYIATGREVREQYEQHVVDTFSWILQSIYYSEESKKDKPMKMRLEQELKYLPQELVDKYREEECEKIVAKTIRNIARKNLSKIEGIDQTQEEADDDDQ